MQVAVWGTAHLEFGALTSLLADVFISAVVFV